MSRQLGTSFSMPMTVTSTSGSVVHIRPLPSDSNTHTVPNGDGVRVRVGGQRPDVHHAAGGARDGHGHREAGAELARHGGLPATAAALVDGRADEPLHVVLDRRPAW